MAEITDEFMRQILGASKDYCIVLLKTKRGIKKAGAEKIIWEHGRRNFFLRAEGKLPIVFRVTDDSNLAGIGIFNATEDEVKAILEEDPAVKAGIFACEIHPCKSFPGDCLPA
ncbi:MAG TPA: hypothetical protein VKM55_03125 [Candidatus Lokiarchaeia archaeon]|nr:hypothetical protein [Candidatus Lokiarchaeia archaeon]